MVRTPVLRFRAVQPSIISFSCAASFPGSSSWLFDPIAPRLSDLPSVSCRKMAAEQEDSSFRLLQTRDGAVLPVPTTAASRRVWLSDVPTSKGAYFCPALFRAGPPLTRGLQNAFPHAQFATSIPSAREPHKSLR